MSRSTRDQTSTGNTLFGYVSGGNGPTPGQTTTLDRIDYSNDTATATPKGNLITPSSYNRGVSTGNESFGYFTGGSSTDVQRIDYSNDTATAVARGKLNIQAAAFGAASNSSFGYFAGGEVPSSPSRITTVNRLDYSNDTANAVDKGPLSVARFEVGAVSSASHGYFAGGSASGPAAK